MTTKTDSFDLDHAPARIGAVRLKVRDSERVSAFYRDVLGLRTIKENESNVVLGTAARPLVELIVNANFAPRDPRGAGLFHTAFRLPRREDLRRWLAFAVAHWVPLYGAADHAVSEAIYLADPEGNGIEIYVDRPPSGWTVEDGIFAMTTDPLDLSGLLDGVPSDAWKGMPEGAVIGHIHLQVGDTAMAERFYGDLLGFDVTSRYPGGSFFGTGGYHHQIAGNSWNSRLAGERPTNMAGLDGFELVVPDVGLRNAVIARAEAAGIAARPRGDGVVLHDPWNAAVTLHG